MNNFCTNCGNRLNSNDIFCTICGTKVKNENVTKTTYPGKGLGIASMVLGIISAFYGLIYFFVSFCIFASDEIFYSYEKVIISFILVFWPGILAILGFIFSLVSRSKKNTGINLAGFILNISALALCFLSIVFIICA